MASIKTKKLNKYYVDKKEKTATAVLYDVDLDIPDGKFTVVVGPSGCGKTTLLKTLAGVIPADDGKIYFSGADVTDALPKDRNVSLVTQEYALYPHLTVFDNVAYPLKLEKVPAEELRRRVNDALGLLDISLLSSRKPAKLSGGQRQRVAIARALVKEPDVVFMDEPLSNLDAATRKELAEKLKNISATTRATFVYVTHNDEEARFLADYIVKMENGSIKLAMPAKDYYNL